jgi:hypothetical protein
LKGMFLIDVMSSFPWQIFEYIDTIDIQGGDIKLLRVLRFQRMARFLRILRLFKLFRLLKFRLL